MAIKNSKSSIRQRSLKVFIIWGIAFAIFYAGSKFELDIKNLKNNYTRLEHKLTDKNQKLSELTKIPVSAAPEERDIIGFYKTVRSDCKNLFVSRYFNLKDPRRKALGNFVIYYFTLQLYQPYWNKVVGFIDKYSNKPEVRFSRIGYSDKKWVIQFAYITYKTENK